MVTDHVPGDLPLIPEDFSPNHNGAHLTISSVLSEVLDELKQVCWIVEDEPSDYLLSRHKIQHHRGLGRTDHSGKSRRLYIGEKDIIQNII